MPQITIQPNSCVNSLSKKSNGANFFTSMLEAYVGNVDKDLCGDKLKLKQLPPPKIITIESSSNLSPKSSNTWENLEQRNDFTSKSFSSESPTSIYHHIKSLAVSKGTAEIYSVSLPKLINDIKLLLIGIESESFKRGEKLKFYTTINWSCEDISDFSHYLDAFLEAGTCFRRLKTYTSKSPFNQCHIFDGFLFKAFCDRIAKFLDHCRDLIYSQEAESFLELHENTKKLRNVITNVARFLKLHPSHEPKENLEVPRGSDFLKLLYDEYTKVFNSDLKCFYIELLKSCCEVYYLRYQQWFYNGQLDDPHKELFIYFTDYYPENTKIFFDKAYLIRKQSVPGFLQGCADNVLLCGKYTMLLRSFKPMVKN